MIGTGKLKLVAATLAVAGAMTAHNATAQDQAAAQEQPTGQEAYDSPQMGTAPCIVVDEYIIDRVPDQGGQIAYRARVKLGNICGRSMDVRFCFMLAEPTDAGDRICHAGTVRPGSQTTIATDVVPTRIVDREIAWRYVE